MSYAIILAGGIGQRVGAGIPKQFVEILGKPVIIYTLEAYANHPEIDGIELVCVKGFETELQQMVDKYHISKIIKIVEGGKEYENSIMNGVKGLEGIAQPDDVVMIHWSAAPFVSEEIISDNIRVCKEKGNAISACKSYLLYGTNDGDHADKAVNRDSFMTLAAPHSFLYKHITDLYRKVEEQHLFDTIEEAHTTFFMAALGIPMYFSKGNQTNIKITTKEDLQLFEGYVLAKKYKEEHSECSI